VKIRSAEYTVTVVDPQAPFPGELPQVAFAGRSNVGKSSLINVILERTQKKIAHVSGTPGKTQGLNFYLVNDRFFLVDLPGFGFAKAPASVREGWKKLVEGYLRRPDGPRAVVLLVDIRRDPTDDDLKMLDFLADLGIPTLVVITKMDKLSTTQGKKQVALLVTKRALDPEQVITFSAVTREGRDSLLEAIGSLLGPEDEVE
jgi:GTP-binding protein